MIRAVSLIAMRRLDRYTPEICSQLRQIAEHRQWRNWNCADFGQEDVLEELELTYHLHVAAEASGARAGMAPMPTFPINFTDSEGRLDPAEFIKSYARNRFPRAGGTDRIMAVEPNCSMGASSNWDDGSPTRWPARHN